MRLPDPPSDFSGPARDLYDELRRMIGIVQPSRLDSETSKVRFNREDLEVHLEHRDRADWGIWITAGSREAIVGAQNAHEHFFEWDGENGRAWTTVAVDFVAEILRGEIEVETTFRGSKPVAVRHFNRSAQGERTQLVYTGFLTPARLCFWRAKRTTIEVVSYR